MTAVFLSAVGVSGSRELGYRELLAGPRADASAGALNATFLELGASTLQS